MVSVIFAFDWLREWCKFSEPITEQSKAKPINYFWRSFEDCSICSRNWVGISGQRSVSSLKWHRTSFSAFVLRELFKYQVFVREILVLKKYSIIGEHRYINTDCGSWSVTLEKLNFRSLAILSCYFFKWSFPKDASLWILKNKLMWIG